MMMFVSCVILLQDLLSKISVQIHVHVFERSSKANVFIMEGHNRPLVYRVVQKIAQSYEFVSDYLGNMTTTQFQHVFNMSMGLQLNLYTMTEMDIV